MTVLAAAAALFERIDLPDAMSRYGIELMVGRASRRLAAADPHAAASFARAMAQRPIAEHVEAANAQHYELPSSFFDLVLGPQRKYSCCLYGAGAQSLAAAEERALSATAAHADLSDGQRILELGCGWGSLSLWMAPTLPRRANPCGLQFALAAPFHRGAGRRRRPDQSHGGDGRHERIRAAADVRPHCFGGDVRAHRELARSA